MVFNKNILLLQFKNKYSHKIMGQIGDRRLQINNVNDNTRFVHQICSVKPRRTLSRTIKKQNNFGETCVCVRKRGVLYILEGHLSGRLDIVEAQWRELGAVGALLPRARALLILLVYLHRLREAQRPPAVAACAAVAALLDGRLRARVRFDDALSVQRPSICLPMNIRC